MNWQYRALLSALFAGLTAILAKVGVTGVSPDLATAVRTAVILVFSGSIAAVTSKPAELAGLSPRTWIFLTLSGLATGLSWLCHFRAIQLGDASRVAPVDKLSVVFAIVLGVLVLKEKFTRQAGLGGGLILAGALVLGRPKA